MDVAVARIHTGIFQKGLRDMNQLQFAAAARLIDRESQILRPGQYRGHVNFLWCTTWNCHVLGVVAVVRRVWLYRQAATNVVYTTLGATRDPYHHPQEDCLQADAVR